MEVWGQVERSCGAGSKVFGRITDAVCRVGMTI
jgi:hypothetical protein